MKSFILLVAAISLSGCISYRISPENKPLQVDAATPLRIVHENKRPEGFQCFEPMLWFVTVGIIPFQCIDTYDVTVVTSIEPVPEAKYKVTSIGGWAALFIAPFPSWHFGKPEKVESQIESVIRRTNK